jgi:hypothetical protein
MNTRERRSRRDLFEERLVRRDLEVTPDPSLGPRIKVRDLSFLELKAGPWNDAEAYAGKGSRPTTSRKQPFRVE